MYLQDRVCGGILFHHEVIYVNVNQVAIAICSQWDYLTIMNSSAPSCPSARGQRHLWYQ